MGSKPKVQGGMTAAEQQAQLDKEHAFQLEQEKQRRQWALEDEAKRQEAEAQQREQMKKEENAAIQRKTLAEQEAIMEAQAQATKDALASIDGQTGTTVDFLGSLTQGITSSKIG